MQSLDIWCCNTIRFYNVGMEWARVLQEILRPIGAHVPVPPLQ